MNLLESLKRFFEARTRPPAESVEQPTADRPPPLETPSSPAPTPPAVSAVVDKASDVKEVRALLVAVAEAPVPAPESAVDVPPVVAEPTPAPPPEVTPTFAATSDQETARVSGAARTAVGDALVLTLATPPATFTVAKGAATIGRGQENAIRLDDLSVSRRHARIAYKQGGYWLSDLGSMGGTWVDGTRLSAPQRIASGQVIDIGLCRLTVSYAGGPAKADAKKSGGKARSDMAAQGRRRR